ncbi:MAG: 1-deoxypentalenic acid 11-beta-hydroxylase [Planctomycetota bacterium]|jgi:ectoine hydroxylase-related dioxygenase (phytanoyl-CoA dioxygenase family)
MNYYHADAKDIDTFLQQGYVIVPGLFSVEEVSSLNRIARGDERVKERATSRSDAQGGTTTLSLSNALEDDIYSRIVASRRVAENMSQFLGDEVYHYHHKMMLKEPKVGGAWEWHQDYGYWYNFGCLYPTMGSCYIAIDKATRENGCLQLIPGSHHLGRIDHGKVGGQTGVDAERMAAILQRLPIVYAEMDPGDGLFFHGNLLHRSDQNTSDFPRWGLICCYNTKRNDPYKESRHPKYAPLTLLDDEKVFQD